MNKIFFRENPGWMKKNAIRHEINAMKNIVNTSPKMYLNAKYIFKLGSVNLIRWLPSIMGNGKNHPIFIQISMAE